MTQKQTLEIIIQTSGFTMEKYELIRDGSMVGYEFEVQLDGKFQFQVAADSYEDALRETLEGIYNTEDVQFNAVN